ncbi:MAG: tripartite tricarboxylate transporter substrate binding protein [Variovorax sp.]
MKKRHWMLRLAAVVIAGAWASCALAQTTYPDKPLRFIVPFPAGGVTDTIARAIGNYLSKSLGQPVIVDNRAGAGGNLGLQLAAKAPADGYTIAMGATSTLSVSPYLYKNLSFDARKDFTPVAMLATIQNVLIVNKQVPASTFAEFVAYLKANPGKVNFASPGSGNSSHLAGEMFKQRLDVDIRHVPYKGDAPAMIDLIGGQVQMMFATVATAFPYIQSGQLRPLVIAGPDRSAVISTVPTMAEVGVPNFDTDAWFGIVAPTGTPAPVVERLNRQINAALASPEIRNQLMGLGLRPAPLPLAAFGELLQRESAKWGELVRSSGASVD